MIRQLLLFATLFVTLFLFLSPAGIAQTFFYFEANLIDQKQVPVNYYTLLHIEPDGTTTARIRYMKAETNQQIFVEQKFSEQVDTTGMVSPDDTKKYLVPAFAPMFLGEAEDTGFIQIRIVCAKKTDSLGAFYEPVAVEFIHEKNNWHAAETKTIQQKSLDDLARNKAFTEIFYPPGDVLHSYIFDFKTRGLNNAELKTKFYFIGVANTNDRKIGVSAQMDLNKMIASLKAMTEQLGISFLPTIISGFDFTKTNIENIIDTFKSGASDIVMFYYTGHGFRYPNDKSDFPRVSLRLNTLQKIEDNNLVIEDVYDRLLKKGARFTLVLSDCCNETIDAPIPFGLALFRSRSIGSAPRLNIDNWKALFFPSKPSSILIGSAQKNQLAVCNKELGGFYTNYFVAELEKSLFTNNPGVPNWWGILNAARENTRFKSLSALCGQNPERRCVQSAAMKVFVSR